MRNGRAVHYKHTRVNTSHHLVLIGSDHNYIHDPIQNVSNARRLHPPSRGGRVAGGNVLAANLLLCQVLQTPDLSDGKTKVGHHPAGGGGSGAHTYVHTHSAGVQEV